MSSLAVRNLINAFIVSDLPLEKAVEVSAEFEYTQDFLDENGITYSDPWLGVQFVGSDEEPVDINASNINGKYRESGIIYLHVTEIAKIGPKTSLFLRCEEIRKKFRGKRLGDLVVKKVSPPNTGIGATLNFEGGWTAALIQVDYEYDFDATP